MFSTYLQIAVRNLLQAKRRTTFLFVALTMVAMLLVTLLSLSLGINENLVRSATTLSSGHINVGGFYKVTTDDVAPIVTDAAAVRKDVEELTPDLDYVIARNRGWAKLVSNTSSMYAGLNGIDVKEEGRLIEVLKLAPEADYKEGGGESTASSGDIDRLVEPDSVLIFAAQAKRLEVGVGDRITVRTETMRGQSNTVDVTVVAIAQDLGLMSSWTIFVPRATVLDLYQLKPDTTGAVQVYLKDIDDSNATMGVLRDGLAEKGYKIMDHQPVPFWGKFETVQGEDWTGQKLDLTTWEDEASYLSWILAAFDTITIFLIGVLIIIVAIGIMNTMWMSVRERTQEIGTLRAIGMGRLAVLGLFVLEAAVLGLSASAFGALLGAILGIAVNAAAIEVPIDAMRTILLSDTIYFAISPATYIRSTIALTAFTVLSALWPAIRASRLQPVTAMQHTE